MTQISHELQREHQPPGVAAQFVSEMQKQKMENSQRPGYQVIKEGHIACHGKPLYEAGQDIFIVWHNNVNWIQRDGTPLAQEQEKEEEKKKKREKRKRRRRFKRWKDLDKQT